MSSVSVFITSYLEGQASAVEASLRQFHKQSDGRHLLTDDPSAADLILVGAIGNEVDRLPYLRQIVRHDVIDKHADKCFSLSLRDQPVVFNRGLYESSSTNWFSRGRVRTGAYPRSTFNSLVASHQAGNADIEPKRYLFSFIGRASHPVRQRLFECKKSRDDVLIEDSSNFDFWGTQTSTERECRLRYYYDALLQSRFSLCPRGAGTGSIRLFESMLMGVAPIIVSDDWILPKGPAWKDFAIVVREKQIAEIERIASEHESTHVEMGQCARRAYFDYFADDRYFNYVVDNCLDILRTQRIAERHYWTFRYAVRLLAAPDSLRLYLDRPKYYLARLGKLARIRRG